VDSRQLNLQLDWGLTPWLGVSPRCLTKGYLRDVEKSRTFAKPATVTDDFTDPAQLTMFVRACPNGLLQKEV